MRRVFVDWRKALYLLFVDFTIAFDSLKRDEVWKILSKCEIPQEILSVVKQEHGSFTCNVVHRRHLSEQ